MKNLIYFTLMLIVFLYGCESFTNMENDSHRFNGKTVSSAELTNHIEQIRQEKPKRSAEMHFHRISEKVPGFGGFYINDEGEYVIIVTENAQRELTRSVAAEEIHIQKHGIKAESIIVKDGQFEFTDLALWRELISAFVLGNDDFDFVLSTDVDETSNKVIIGIEESKFSEDNLSVIKNFISSNLDIPYEAIGFKETTPIRPEYLTTDFSTLSGTLSSHNRPLVGGLEIRKQGAGSCTMGFNALLDGQNVFITNSHCTNSTFSNDNTTFFQAARLTNNIVGTEYKDPNTSWCGVLQPFWNCRNSDAAAIKILNGVDHARGFIARTLSKNSSGGHGSKIINQSKPVFSIARIEDYISTGEIISKIGYRTGWTEGQVTETCTDVNVPGGAWKLKCQYGANYYSDDGDSGSPVFRVIYDINGNEHASLYGIHFGSGSGTRYFSPMSGIRSDLGNVYANDPNSTYTPPPPFNGGGGPVYEDPCEEDPLNCHEP